MLIGMLTALGDPLLLGLQELAQKRPADPVTYLATFLYNYANRADRDYSKVSQLIK